MRVHHAIAIVAVILIGFGVKVLFLPTPGAEADIRAVQSSSINVLQMHLDFLNMRDLPLQELHDMTFVFADGG
jgi:hypothetical protein